MPTQYIGVRVVLIHSNLLNGMTWNDSSYWWVIDGFRVSMIQCDSVLKWKTVFIDCVATCRPFHLSHNFRLQSISYRYIGLIDSAFLIQFDSAIFWIRPAPGTDLEMIAQVAAALNEFGCSLVISYLSELNLNTFPLGIFNSFAHDSLASVFDD